METTLRCCPVTRSTAMTKAPPPALIGDGMAMNFARRQSVARIHMLRLQDAAQKAELQKALAAAEELRRTLDQKVEVRTQAELDQAIAGGADSILLDNMTPSQVKKAVKQIRAALPTVPIEASGNMNLKTVRKYALAGVDFVSVGALTHSAAAADLSMRITADLY